ncbi:MAG: hypothetical protein NTW82_11460 [Bacteroidia bacterium]|nr:hypothetical protein [Bacteroidia bacterium]
MKYLIIVTLLFLYSLSIEADIAPSPIQATGISMTEPAEIKMTYEKVVVDLTIDSSFVHCFFRLHNKGKAQKIQIGYPNMNYYSNGYNSLKFNPINVYENGEKINNIVFFTPDSINLAIIDNNKKPWYLWDTYFDENEIKVIVVSYSLPHGLVKNNLYSKFDYLLSTGSGWYGTIDTAEIIVNLKNIDKELLLKVTPDNFTESENQIVWKYNDLEPDLKNNISIKYEEAKGTYQQRLAQINPPVYILDEKEILSNDIRDKNSLENLDWIEIAWLEILRDKELIKEKFPKSDATNGIVLIYSKQFVIKKLTDIVHSRIKGKMSEISYSTTSDFENKYLLVINKKTIEKGVAFYKEILEINEQRIIDIKISNRINNIFTINIKLKE